MKPSTTTRFVAAVLVLVLMLGGGACAVDAAATVATTCKAAAASDVRVNLQLCESRLGELDGDTTDADAWSLAKDSSNEGMYNAALAADDVKTLLAKGSPSVAMKPVLDKCAAVYGKTTLAFAQASVEINRRNYAAGRNRLDEALALAQQCNAAAFGATPPQPLARHAAESIQMAIIAGAITNLIK